MLDQNYYTYQELLTKSQALDEAGAGITIAEAKTNTLIYANKSFYELTKYDAEEVMHRNCKFLQGPDTDKETLGKISYALYNRTSFVGEILNYKKTGETFWNLLVINPVLNEQGEVSHYVGFQHDISHMKNIETALTFKSAEFNNFIYRTSHNLRGPIATILGLTSLAENPMTLDEAKNYFTLIQKSASNLDYILKNLIEIVSYNDRQVIFSDVKVESIIQAIIKPFERQKYLKIVTEVDQEDIIHTDVYLLTSALTQILNNAVLFRKSVTGDHAISIIAKRSAGGFTLVVKDNGLGMEEDVASRAFDLFFKGSVLSIGNGIGLYIAKNYLDRLHGRIKIKSQLNEGTEVSIELCQWN